MNYREIRIFEQAFKKFLVQVNRKRELLIRYYELRGKNSDAPFAFVGYEPKEGGKHGLHYDARRKEYFFGTRDKEQRLCPEWLNFSLTEKIPQYLKEAFLEVVKKCEDKKLRKDRL